MIFISQRKLPTIVLMSKVLPIHTETASPPEVAVSAIRKTFPEGYSKQQIYLSFTIVFRFLFSIVHQIFSQVLRPTFHKSSAGTHLP